MGSRGVMGFLSLGESMILTAGGEVGMMRQFRSFCQLGHGVVIGLVNSLIWPVKIPLLHLCCATETITRGVASRRIVSLSPAHKVEHVLYDGDCVAGVLFVPMECTMELTSPHSKILVYQQ